MRDQMVLDELEMAGMKIQGRDGGQKGERREGGVL
jgi:hypothetical protein